MTEKISRKHKGDACFLLEKQGDLFHFKKNIKVHLKKITKGAPKTTRIVVSDFYFKKCDIESINFTLNGLRDGDKDYLISMVEELSE